MTPGEAFKLSDAPETLRRSGNACVYRRDGNPTAIAMCDLVDAWNSYCVTGTKDQFVTPSNVNKYETTDDGIVCPMYNWDDIDCKDIWKHLETILRKTYPDAQPYPCHRIGFRRQMGNGFDYGFMAIILMPDPKLLQSHKCHCPKRVLFAQGCQCGGV